MTLVLVPFERRHLEDFEPGRTDIANTQKLIDMSGWEGLAVTARDDRQTLGIAGIALLEDTAHVWLVLSDAFRRRPIALCRYARHFLAGVSHLPEVTRLRVEADGDAAQRWAIWLGFKSIGARKTEYGIEFDKTGVDAGFHGGIRHRYD